MWGRKCLKKRPRPEGVRRRNSRNSLLINLHSSVTTIRRWVRTEVIHSVTSFFLGKSELFCRVPCNEIFPVGTDDLSLTLCSVHTSLPLPILLASHATTCTQFARRERRTSDAKKLRHCHAFGARRLFFLFSALHDDWASITVKSGFNRCLHGPCYVRNVANVRGRG